MPQKVPWPDKWLVAFRGRSTEGDILLDFAKYWHQLDPTGRKLSRSEVIWNWWAKHPELLKALASLHRNPAEESPFWQKSFSSCGSYFKCGLPMEDAVIVAKRQQFCLQSGFFTCVWLLHPPEAVSTLQSAINLERPVTFGELDKHQLFLFGQNLWKVRKDELAADPEHFRLMFLEAVDDDRLQFERLRNKFSDLAGARSERPREPLSESVRIFVWRRDGGKCVRCGSNQRLEFDHIIPVIEGGSSTERNIQLLCETCNRRKGTKI